MKTLSLSVVLLFAGCATDQGFQELFDETSLDGWVTTGGRYDGKAVWTVEEGTITGRVGPDGQGGLIYTEKAYRDFVLELEAWVDYPFDSGIFLHMTPEAKGVQITIDYRPDGDVGGIYSDGWLQRNPDGKARFKRDDWNHFRVECRGGSQFHLRVWMNGAPLIEYQLPEGMEGFADTGLIGLQVHGGRDDPRSNKASFRNIRLSPLESTS
ncbi:MAG: 3-keto-disaccharide hydrolase [Planctomycetota bacterium]|jgi:hypothetical protein